MKTRAKPIYRYKNRQKNKQSENALLVQGEYEKVLLITFIVLTFYFFFKPLFKKIMLLLKNMLE